MDILNETYQVLKELDLVHTETEFSLIWLQKSKRYFSMVKHSDQSPSVEALWSLLVRLKEHGQGRMVVTRLLEQRLEQELRQAVLTKRRSA